jgi:ParB family chromosome partitioning protein
MATASPAALNAGYEYAEIDLALIDEPAVPERQTMEEAELAELALSIQDVGLIKPLIVQPTGERYEVIAGHRRLLSCRMVKLSPVPCRIRRGDPTDNLSILVHENAHTEAVNPIEEAAFYSRVLVEQCDNDVDLLCLRVRRRREFVEDRLLLLMGHPKVIDALANKRISLAVARELNKVPDPLRLLILLDQSIQMGATARQVMEWRKHYDGQERLELPPDAAEGADGSTPAPVVTSGPRCMMCADTFDPASMEIVYIHKLCSRQLDRMLNRAPDETAGS